MFSWANLEGQMIGPYHLEKLLGAGTFGAVFKANEVVRDRFIRSVAIKIYREGPNIPFKFPLEELIATTALEHPNVIRGYFAREDEVGKTGFKVLYLVMELADGTLNHYHRANSLKSADIREIAIAIASGLIYLHKQGKIHRDLKPDNILRVKKVWKLSDLGLIRDLVTRSYLETQHVNGTYAYMSPEVFDGIISPAFDVWSLGIILVELTTGKLPYQFNDEHHLMKRVMNYELQLPTLPDEFKPIILGCLQKDRQRRWTAQQVLTALQPTVIQFATPQASPFPRLQIPLVPPNLFSPSPRLQIPSRPQVLTLDLPGKIKLEMIKIPAGSFLMGSADNDPGAYDTEKPQHRVTLQEYYLGKYPVTQEQYQALMGKNPSHFKDNPKNPVENVSWKDAKSFCQKLNDMTGKTSRLPTEAEWEYGCRAGTTTPFYFGETISTEQANYNGNYTFGKGKKGIYRQKTTPVGSFPANKFGVYDMHGNVWEWCEDSWHDSYKEKPEEPKRDGNIIWSSSNESRHVLRGGSWNENPRYCRSAGRSWLFADSRGSSLGFRLALGSP